MSEPLHLDVLGCRFRVDCRDTVSSAVIQACYSGFVTDGTRAPCPGTDYRILRAGDGWRLECEQQFVLCETLADLIYDFEKDMTIRVQLQRPEWLFIHAAAVAKDDRSIIIAGESGAGKSTLCWTLCNAGFEYMSDELAPVHPESGIVQSYPHALCLKQRPDFMPELSPRIVDAGRTLHIPLSDIPGPHALSATSLAAIVFIDKDKTFGPAGRAEPVGAAEAAARLYANSLNPLAHQRDGLAPVSRIAAAAPAYRLARAELGSMVNAIRQLLRRSPLAA